MMHMRGTPQTMKCLTNYDNLIKILISIFRSVLLQPELQELMI